MFGLGGGNAGGDGDGDGEGTAAAMISAAPTRSLVLKTSPRSPHSGRSHSLRMIRSRNRCMRVCGERGWEREAVTTPGPDLPIVATSSVAIPVAITVRQAPDAVPPVLEVAGDDSGGHRELDGGGVDDAHDVAIAWCLNYAEEWAL